MEQALAFALYAAGVLILAMVGVIVYTVVDDWLFWRERR